MRKALEHKRTSALRSSIVSIVGGLAALSTLLVMFGLAEVGNPPPSQPQSDGRVAGVMTDRSSLGAGLSEPPPITVAAPELPVVPLPAVRPVSAVATTPTTTPAPAPAAPAPAVVEPAVVVASVQTETPAPAKKERAKHRPHRAHRAHQPKESREPRDAQAQGAGGPAAPSAVDPAGEEDKRGREPRKPRPLRPPRSERSDATSDNGAD